MLIGSVIVHSSDYRPITLLGRRLQPNVSPHCIATYAIFQFYTTPNTTYIGRSKICTYIWNHISPTIFEHIWNLFFHIWNVIHFNLVFFYYFSWNYVLFTVSGMKEDRHELYYYCYLVDFCCVWLCQEKLSKTVKLKTHDG